MRIARYRLISWVDVREKNKEPIFVELFDHIKDPNETLNIVTKETLLVNELLFKLGDTVK